MSMDSIPTADQMDAVMASGKLGKVELVNRQR